MHNDVSAVMLTLHHRKSRAKQNKFEQVSERGEKNSYFCRSARRAKEEEETGEVYNGDHGCQVRDRDALWCTVE
jgi:hypothetical protein